MVLPVCAVWGLPAVGELPEDPAFVPAPWRGPLAAQAASLPSQALHTAMARALPHPPFRRGEVRPSWLPPP